jgi:hypothetical protein
MKNIKLLFATVSVMTIFTFSQCKKNKTEEPQLPPETTTGAMTFGCKVNGQVFLPKDGNGRPGLFVQYINLGAGVGGGWFLNIPAIDWKTSSIPGINIGTDSLLVIEGSTYEFKLSNNFQPVKGTAYANYVNGSDAYPKLNSESGSLFIKKFDQVNRILSGTFFFTGKNSNGVKINITEGRFDIRY